MPHANREARNKYARDYARSRYRSEPEYRAKISVKNKTYREEHRDAHRATDRRYYSKLRQQVLAAYGHACACCGNSQAEFLTLDHINGGGAKERRRFAGGGMYAHVKKLGFPKDVYRLLCMNCNWALGMYGYCPHQQKV